jgi:hypothetical protein
MSNKNQSLQNVFNMNNYQREINRQRYQGIEPRFINKPRILRREEINKLARSHRLWNRGTRKVRYKEKANVRLFQHNNEAGRGKKGNNHTLSNSSKRMIWRIPDFNRRATNLKEPLEWEHYQSMEPNEPRNQRPIEMRLRERNVSRHVLNYLRKTRKLFLNRLNTKTPAL